MSNLSIVVMFENPTTRRAGGGSGGGGGARGLERESPGAEKRRWGVVVPGYENAGVLVLGYEKRESNPVQVGRCSGGVSEDCASGSRNATPPHTARHLLARQCGHRRLASLVTTALACGRRGYEASAQAVRSWWQCRHPA